MMKLHWSPRSPFVRKVMIVLHEVGLVDQVELVRSTVAMASEPNPSVLADNPLGKIPTLVLEDGATLFDSRVICAFLAEKAGKLQPASSAERWRQARWEALGDGMTDILLLWRIERLRQEGGDTVICAAFETKIRATMHQLNAEASQLADAGFGIGHIAIGAALGQLEFRWPGTGWREAFPALEAVEGTLNARASFIATRVADDQTAAPAADMAELPAFTFIGS
jgi:glutathione S-transferase